jgi:hypothetical protein
MKNSLLIIIIIGLTGLGIMIAAFILPKESEFIWTRLKSIVVVILGSQSIIEIMIGLNKLKEKNGGKK